MYTIHFPIPAIVSISYGSLTKLPAPRLSSIFELYSFMTVQISRSDFSTTSYQFLYGRPESPRARYYRLSKQPLGLACSLSDVQRKLRDLRLTAQHTDTDYTTLKEALEEVLDETKSAVHSAIKLEEYHRNVVSSALASAKTSWALERWDLEKERDALRASIRKAHGHRHGSMEAAGVGQGKLGGQGLLGAPATSTKDESRKNNRAPVTKTVKKHQGGSHTIVQVMSSRPKPNRSCTQSKTDSIKPNVPENERKAAEAKGKQWMVYPTGRESIFSRERAVDTPTQASAKQTAKSKTTRKASTPHAPKSTTKPTATKKAPKKSAKTAIPPSGAGAEVDPSELLPGWTEITPSDAMRRAVEAIMADLRELRARVQVEGIQEDEKDKPEREGEEKAERKRAKRKRAMERKRAKKQVSADLSPTMLARPA